MTAAMRVPAEGYPSPPEPGLTPDEVVARAEKIASTLIDRQAETEQRGYYALDTHDELLRAGLYRILVPRRYGGYEFDLGTYMKVVSALARGCPSTGWMYTFGASHALMAGSLFGESAQDELFAGGDFISPATVAPVGFAERADDGGWIVDGTHTYCSGSPYATHFIGHTLVAGPEPDDEPMPLIFALPRSQWERLDDWGAQLGLKGSGSHSVKIERAHVPEHLALIGHVGQMTVTDGTPGRELHGPRYGGGILSEMQFPVAALSIGMAKGALDAYAELMRERTTIYPPITLRAENADYQSHYGEAVGLIATAEAALADAVREWEETSARGAAAFTREVDLRLALICREVIRLTWRAVDDELFPTAGSSAVRTGSRVERVWRDMSTLHSHGGISVYLASMANRELAGQIFDDVAS
jgi:3-hydroxy-9,10-secoandrosta-1,3,5(10)-triene-9,17-dione monooxygenase